MSSNVNEAAIEKVIETILLVLEFRTRVSVLVLAKLYGWFLVKKVSRVLCGWPKTRERSTERSLCYS